MDDHFLNKYWDAETSLEEEAKLMDAHAEAEGPEAEYFRAIREARRQKSRLTLDAIHAYNKAHEVHQASPVVLPLHRWIASAAAVLIFCVSAIGLWNYSQQTQQDPYMAETYDNPEEAYQEMRQALAFMSTKLNKSQDEALLNIKKASEYADMFK